MTSRGKGGGGRPFLKRAAKGIMMEEGGGVDPLPASKERKFTRA